MGWLFKKIEGELYVRDLRGYKTYLEAMIAAKERWKQGYAVQIARGRFRWQVWRAQTSSSKGK